MFKASWIAAGLLLAITSASARQAEVTTSQATVVHDQAAKQLLLGNHRLTLQWISWTRFGQVEITDSDGSLHMKGDQKSAENSDYLHIDGVITQIDAGSFAFRGTIVMQVGDTNGGKPCTRQGDMTFRKTGARKYWRLKEMQNPCVPAGDMTTDYVDVYLR
jgi:FlaG/FlaF family flagellin (archaellin)